MENGSGDDSVPKLQITVVGDATVGKTCLLYAYVLNSFPEEYSPSAFDNTQKLITVDGSVFSMTLVDTTGYEQFPRLRELSYKFYPKTDCFLLCYAINDPASLINVEQQWAPEIRRHCPEAAFILVGSNSDLRSEERYGNICVSPEQVEQTRERIGAATAVECSAKTQHNLTLVFEEAVRAVTLTKNRRSKPNLNRFCKIS